MKNYNMPNSFCLGSFIRFAARLRKHQRLRCADSRLLTVADHVELRGDTVEPDGSIYDEVFAGNVGCSNLEDVFQLFNLVHPSDYEEPTNCDKWIR